MSGRAKTIQIFLPHGDPRGIRMAHLTTRVIQAIEVPRALLERFLEMPESRQVGLYFLVGKAETDDQAKLYVGQTVDLRQRLAAHNQKREFWDRALVMTSRTEPLTQTQTAFLESHCIQLAEKAGRYALENDKGGNKVPTTPSQLADCEEYFETGQILLATLGYPLFEPVAGASPIMPKELFHCTGSGTGARGSYTAEGFVVFQGSSGRSECAPSFKGRAEDKLRRRLVEDGVLIVDGQRITFAKDHVFSTPSAAAGVVMGRAANGWEVWRREDGQTLDHIHRRSSAASEDEVN